MTENKILREVVEETFKNILVMEWVPEKKAHKITTTNMTGFDLTPEMGNEILENIKTSARNGALACPKTAKMVAELNYDCTTVLDLPPITPPKIEVQHTNSMYNADDYYPEAIYLWKDTYAFREWFKKGDEPGGGINYRDIETLDATTAKEIKTCWAFEVNRTFTSAKDLSVTLSIGEYLTEKFGIEVNEHDADIAEDGEVDEEAPPV